MLAESKSGCNPARLATGPTVLSDGRIARVRPASLGDADLLRGMFARLSPQTIYRRFHSPFPSVPAWATARLLDGGGVTLVALAGEELVGHAMGVVSADGREAEVAVLVEDAWQSVGVGKLLLSGLAALAAGRGVEAFICEAFGENRRVLELTRAAFAKVGCKVAGGTLLIRAPLSSLKTSPDYEKGEG